MNYDKRLYLENDYIMQEIEAIKRELLVIESKASRVRVWGRVLTTIVNSKTQLALDLVNTQDTVIVNVTFVGTTTSVGNAIMSLRADDIILLEQSVVFRDNTGVCSMVLNTSGYENISLVIEPENELIPIRIDNVQMYVLSNIN